MSPFLAVDWGSTHLRAWRVELGQAVASVTLQRGVASLARGEAEAVFYKEVAPALDSVELPAILCGMIGSTLGWRVAPYVTAPASLESISAALLEVAPGVRIVPGVRRADGSDVMRGEETKALGWLAGNLEHAHGSHCLIMPGTHSKHASIERAHLAKFQTFMTGELFALLRERSTLKQAHSAWSDDAFDEGAARGRELGWQALFETRARVVSGIMPERSAESFLSGVLVGAECAYAPPGASLIGAPDLTRLYARVIPGAINEDADAVLAGLIAIHKRAT